MIWHDDGKDSGRVFEERIGDIGSVRGVELLPFYDEGWRGYPLRVTGTMGEIWLSDRGAVGDVLARLGYSDEVVEEAKGLQQFVLDLEGFVREPVVKRGELLPEEEELLAFIQEYYEEEGKTPTYAKMSRFMGYHADSGSQRHVAALEQKGRVQTVYRKGIIWFEGKENGF